MTNIPHQLQTIGQLSQVYAEAAGRSRDSVKLIAVSKKHPVDRIITAMEAGQKDFGENYLQELQEKNTALPQPLREKVIWHFIGPVQSNKTRQVSELADWVHTVDRWKIAQRLSNQRPDHLPDLNLCVQVNIDRSPTKSGVQTESVAELANAISELPKIKLRGLMAMPAVSDDYGIQKEAFDQLKKLLDSLNNELDLALDTLSMGMSNDMEAAIMAGATHIRVGTAIFGQRPS